MEIEVNRRRMHPSEFHNRKADMLESIAIGIDDEKTKISGECLKTQAAVYCCMCHWNNKFNVSYTTGVIQSLICWIILQQFLYFEVRLYLF